MSPLDLDDRLFAALAAADIADLDVLLAPDFLLVAEHTGSVVSRAELMAAVASGALTFPAMRAAREEAIVRTAGEAAIVVGCSTMEPDGVVAATRYTHVWAGGRLVSAQGTPAATR